MKKMIILFAVILTGFAASAQVAPTVNSATGVNTNTGTNVKAVPPSTPDVNKKATDTKTTAKSAKNKATTKDEATKTKSENEVKKEKHPVHTPKKVTDKHPAPATPATPDVPEHK